MFEFLEKKRESYLLKELRDIQDEIKSVKRPRIEELLWNCSDKVHAYFEYGKKFKIDGKDEFAELLSMMINEGFRAQLIKEELINRYPQYNPEIFSHLMYTFGETFNELGKYFSDYADYNKQIDELKQKEKEIKNKLNIN
ncbi:MAG: hypothetical protein NC548_15840 [Lachnospiraceae bacterium]|nr:hypothetical protein [Lachnospiraceae bacterium]